VPRANGSISAPELCLRLGIASRKGLWASFEGGHPLTLLRTCRDSGQRLVLDPVYGEDFPAAVVGVDYIRATRTLVCQDSDTIDW